MHWLLDYHQHQPCGCLVNPLLSSLVLVCFLMNPTLHIKDDKRWNIPSFTESLAFWSPSLLIPYHDKTWLCCKSCETHWCYVNGARAEPLHCLLPQPQAVMVTSWLYSCTLKTVHLYTKTFLELSNESNRTKDFHKYQHKSKLTILLLIMHCLIIDNW